MWCFQNVRLINLRHLLTMVEQLIRLIVHSRSILRPPRSSKFSDRSLSPAIRPPSWCSANLLSRPFLSRRVGYHSLPTSIVSDCDTRFLGHFWRSLWKLLGTSLDMSSTYHPQTDDHNEVVNRLLFNLLCCLVDDNIKSWDSKLCQAEFAHNHATNRSTGFSPFLVVFGLIPGIWTWWQHRKRLDIMARLLILLPICRTSIRVHYLIWKKLLLSTKQRQTLSNMSWFLSRWPRVGLFDKERPSLTWV